VFLSLVDVLFAGGVVNWTLLQHIRFSSMEAEFGGKNQYLYGPVVSGMKKAVANGKRSLEWDLNDWKWDGDLFTAQPLNSVPSDCRSRQFFPPHPEIPAKKTNPSNDWSSSAINPGEGNKELEKRRRGVIGEGEGEGLNDEGGSLSLNLGGYGYPFMVEGEEKSRKKTKVIETTTAAATTSNRAVCQVQDCTADLGNAKDYHRRHKVCDVHSKATMALVGNVMQRFCQQCSRSVRMLAIRSFSGGYTIHIVIIKLIFCEPSKRGRFSIFCRLSPE